MLATVVDTETLLDVVLYSVVAGAGVTVVFSMVIVSATRSVELQRDGNWIGAGLFGVIAAVGLAACALGVVFAIEIMADK